jgi:hypothetical protein
MSLTSRLTFSNVVSSLALFLALGGGAYAVTLPTDSSGAPTITACIPTGGGAARAMSYSTTGACSEGSEPITWNQQGVKGSTGQTGTPGQQGAAGPQGPQGPAGPSYVQGKYVGSKKVPGSWTDVATLNVLKGHYEISAKGHGFFPEVLGTSWWNVFECRLLVTEGNSTSELDWTQFEVGDDDNQYAAFALQGLYWTGNAAKVALQCKDNSNDLVDTPKLRRLKLHARQIGGWVASAS